MGKLAEKGIIWIGDSSVYVADLRLFASADDFLGAVLTHIKKLVDSFSEEECGWCEIPRFDKYINRVTKSWMVHRVNCEWYDAPFWENVDEPGRGHVGVWFIDFKV